MVDDPYLRPAIRPSSLDRAVQRRAILDFLHEVVPAMRGTVLDVGCGHQPYRNLVTGTGATYVGLDLGLELGAGRYRPPDVVWSGDAAPIRSDSIDAAFATELLEHVPDPRPLLAEVHRVLRPGGTLALTVPFLWPLHDVPDDQWRYTPFALERLLADAGFVDVSLRATGGWDASLAQLLGLWARRRPMRPRLRTLASWALTPVVAALVRADRRPTTFAESTMLTGIAGTATKPTRSPNT